MGNYVLASAHPEETLVKRVYLDHAATTPLLPAAREAMLPWLEAGNPSTLYAEGRHARQAIDKARETLAQAFECEFAEVVFTSGGTESAALAILGAALAADGTRTRVLISAAEHHCVLNTRPALESLGFQVEFIPVDREARVEPDSVRSLLSEDVLLVCAMQGNNEVGSISNVAEIAVAAHEHGALLFCDCVQTFMKERAGETQADMISVSGHKIGGPKGAGALFVRAGTRLKAVIAGGGQERELRGGTENVAAIAGFGAAVGALATDDSLQELRDSFSAHLTSLGAVPTVKEGKRLAGHVHVRFPGISAETLLIVLDRTGIAAGSGAACSSGSIEPSHVLLACGYSLAEAKEGVRFTLGRGTNQEDLEWAANQIDQALAQLKR